MNTKYALDKLGNINPDFIKIALSAVIALMLWQLLPRLLYAIDQTTGSIDPSIWMLMLMAIIAFLSLTGLSWLLLKWFWNGMGLPAISNMVSQFNILELWQQLSLFWGSFALLLLAGALCLNAIC